ncbi:hypothetical protein [Paenibacillus sp. IHBB 3054]|uniref:hypothetical protein n=1 Tax=Paenibacillus sp. IHBB 3054 TaxID=3425689 RepID=UPI003F6751A7
MGALANINQSFNKIEEQLKYFIHNNSTLEFVEMPLQYIHAGTFAWARLKPNEIHMQSLVLTDYVALITLCSLMLKNVKSSYIEEFEQSSETVLSYIGQNTLLVLESLEAVFAEIKAELDVQRFIIAQPYQL